MKPISTILPMLALLTTGCMPFDAGFGEIHHANIERQVVDPDPQYAEEEIEGANGERAAAAVNRYQQGTVKEPAVMSTSSRSGQAPGASGPN